MNTLLLGATADSLRRELVDMTLVGRMTKEWLVEIVDEAIKRGIIIGGTRPRRAKR
jgi:hypothetical protein